MTVYVAYDKNATDSLLQLQHCSISKYACYSLSKYFPATGFVEFRNCNHKTHIYTCIYACIVEKHMSTQTT